MKWHATQSKVQSKLQYTGNILPQEPQSRHLLHDNDVSWPRANAELDAIEPQQEKRKKIME